MLKSTSPSAQFVFWSDVLRPDLKNDGEVTERWILTLIHDPQNVSFCLYRIFDKSSIQKSEQSPMRRLRRRRESPVLRKSAAGSSATRTYCTVSLPHSTRTQTLRVHERRTVPILTSRPHDLNTGEGGGFFSCKKGRETRCAAAAAFRPRLPRLSPHLPHDRSVPLQSNVR